MLFRSLRPTRIYVKPIVSVLQAAGNRQQGVIKGIAHITGGAFYEKAPRPLPKGLRLRIRKGSWPVPRIFQLIQAGGNVDDREMYRTFNMGVGMILIMKPRYIKAIQKKLASYKIKSWVIGEVVKGEKGTELI